MARPNRLRVARPEVAAVILNYRTPHDSLEAVASLEKAGYKNLQVILVDNGSESEWRERVITEHPRVTFIRNETNLGFAGGCNVGIRRALEDNAEYVLLLNSDALATPGLLKELVFLGDSLPQVGVLGPVILREDGSGVWYQGGSLNRFLGYTRHLGMGQALQVVSDGPVPTDFVPGTVMLVKRNVFETIGLFDEDYFLYFEDLDLSERARKAGIGVVYCPSATALHKVSASAGVRGTNVMTPLRAYYFARNMILFLQRHITGVRRWTSLQGQLYLRAPYRLLTMALDGQVEGFRPYLVGIWHGLLGRTGKWGEHDRFVP